MSRKLEIYDEIPELLSVSLGSVETSLLNLTAAYATFVKWWKKNKTNLINRIQDRRGKTISTSNLLNVKVVIDILKIKKMKVFHLLI